MARPVVVQVDVLAVGANGDIDPAVLRAPFGGEVGGDGLIFAQAKAADAAGRHAGADQHAGHGTCASFAEVLIIGRTTGIVGMADDLNGRAGVFLQAARQYLKVGPQDRWCGL